MGVGSRGVVCGDVVVDFSLYDDTLVVTGFDSDRGGLAAIAITDDPEARAWAEGLYGQHKEEAEILDSVVTSE